MYIHKAELDLVDADGSLFSTFHPFIQYINLDRWEGRLEGFTYMDQGCTGYMWLNQDLFT